MSKIKNDEKLLDMLCEWQDESIESLSLNDLSNLRYILEHLPKEIDISFSVNGKDYDCIEDYIEERTDNFFEVTRKDYEDVVGKCFMSEDKTIAFKVYQLTDREDYEFLYEIFYYYGRDVKEWHNKEYIWLQETAKGQYADKKYLKYCLTPQMELNIASESMFHLGRDGNFYVDITCGGDYDCYKPISENKFNLIREDAIENDGEYKVS